MVRFVSSREATLERHVEKVAICQPGQGSHREPRHPHRDLGLPRPQMSAAEAARSVTHTRAGLRSGSGRRCSRPMAPPPPPPRARPWGYAAQSQASQPLISLQRGLVQVQEEVTRGQGTVEDKLGWGKSGETGKGPSGRGT